MSCGGDPMLHDLTLGSRREIRSKVDKVCGAWQSDESLRRRRMDRIVEWVAATRTGPTRWGLSATGAQPDKAGFPPGRAVRDTVAVVIDGRVERKSLPTTANSECAHASAKRKTAAQARCPGLRPHRSLVLAVKTLPCPMWRRAERYSSDPELSLRPVRESSPRAHDALVLAQR